VLSGDFEPGDVVRVDVVDDGLTFTRGERRELRVSEPELAPAA
jgi:hypothetical protein